MSKQKGFYCPQFTTPGLQTQGRFAEKGICLSFHQLTQAEWKKKRNEKRKKKTHPEYLRNTSSSNFNRMLEEKVNVSFMRTI